MRTPSRTSVLVFFLLSSAVYLIMVLVTLPHLRTIAGGLSPFDLMPAGYDAAYARQLLDALGEPGRTYYLYRQLPLDFLYPGLFGIGYAMLVWWLLNQAGDSRSPWRYAGFLALAGAFFDYCENIAIASMLVQFPDFSDALASTAGLFTVTKSLTITLYFIALLAVVFVFGRRALAASRVAG